MYLLNREINMAGTEICLYCPHMNPDTGYCPRTGEYVNAFWSCRRFYVKEEEEIVPKAVRKWVNPKKGTKPTADRTEKKCSHCGVVKPLSQFVKLSRNADGHGCYCLECNNEIHRKLRERLKNGNDN